MLIWIDHAHVRMGAAGPNNFPDSKHRQLVVQGN